ncbi:MAG: chromosomal replication initiator protein DnaA, partial [Nitrospinae bacterium]|nr:chromosomal replication initiator protein DnaA [Nitrospinota bacterium]
MEILWKNCLDEIEKRVLPENFNTWFTPTYPCAKDEDALTIAVPNRFYEKCLIENYLELIQNVLETVSDKKLAVRFR